MKINSIAQKTDKFYFETKFLEIIESHLTYLRNLRTNRVQPISSLSTEKYKGDLYGLLAFMRINKDYWYIIMRMNHYKSSADFKGDIDYLLIPDMNVLTLLKNIYRTNKKS